MLTREEAIKLLDILTCEHRASPGYCPQCRRNIADYLYLNDGINPANTLQECHHGINKNEYCHDCMAMSNAARTLPKQQSEQPRRIPIHTAITPIKIFSEQYGTVDAITVVQTCNDGKVYIDTFELKYLTVNKFCWKLLPNVPQGDE